MIKRIIRRANTWEMRLWWEKTRDEAQLPWFVLSGPHQVCYASNAMQVASRCKNDNRNGGEVNLLCLFPYLLSPPHPTRFSRLHMISKMLLKATWSGPAAESMKSSVRLSLHSDRRAMVFENPESKIYDGSYGFLLTWEIVTLSWFSAYKFRQ